MCRFEHDVRFVFYLFDLLQRHAVLRQVSNSVRANSGSVRKFEALVNSEGFDERLRKAKNDIESKVYPWP